MVFAELGYLFKHDGVVTRRGGRYGGGVAGEQVEFVDGYVIRTWSMFPKPRLQFARALVAVNQCMRLLRCAIQPVWIQGEEIRNPVNMGLLDSFLEFIGSRQLELCQLQIGGQEPVDLRALESVSLECFQGACGLPSSRVGSVL